MPVKNSIPNRPARRKRVSSVSSGEVISEEVDANEAPRPALPRTVWYRALRDGVSSPLASAGSEIRRSRKIFAFIHGHKPWFSAKADKESESQQKSAVFKQKKTAVFIIISLLLISGLGYFFKDKIIAATVNGRPVFRYQLNQKLVSSFGKEILENMIIEDLIKEEANKKGVLVSEEEIEKEIEKLTKNLGAGTKLEDVLKFQGISLADFKNQLKLRLQVNQILEKEISLSDEEIDKFVKDNAKTLVATSEAERKAEAREKVKEQKINEKVQTWISDLLSKAKIIRFLK